MLVELMPNIIGGSADLSASNNVFIGKSVPIAKDNFNGNYIYYGIREHAMSAIMNGLALSGFVPYGGTFLVFSDYCRPAIRLSAMMGLHVIYIMTHDSIGVGEDGPTHQPIEHLASLRAIPNLFVFRPADAYETIECWRIAMSIQDAPSMLVLSRQDVDFFSNIVSDDIVNGAYVVHATSSRPVVGIFSSGSDVAMAISVANELSESFCIYSKVISCPCLELFDEAGDVYKDSIFEDIKLKVVIESASEYGWSKYVGNNAMMFCIDSFGVSGKCEDVYNYFGLNPKIIAERVVERFIGAR
uniref:transketolase n=1 Tax=Biomphalaria glabrata TaxID=6526 RepID=A0A182Z7B1_BIOGL